MHVLVVDNRAQPLKAQPHDGPVQNVSLEGTTHDDQTALLDVDGQYPAMFLVPAKLVSLHRCCIAPSSKMLSHCAAKGNDGQRVVG